MERNLAELTETEAMVISHRFFNGESAPKQTFEVVGRLIGLSKERVRQVQNVALNKLRDVLQCDPVLR